MLKMQVRKCKARWLRLIANDLCAHQLIPREICIGIGGKAKGGIGKGLKGAGFFKGGKNPAQMQRQEDEVRGRMSTASDIFRKTVQDTQQTRQEYFVTQLPKILRVSPGIPASDCLVRTADGGSASQQLKECADEIDMGTQYHLTRYAFMFESTVLSDGTAISPTSSEAGELDLLCSLLSPSNRSNALHRNRPRIEIRL